jgi:guanylate kinase
LSKRGRLIVISGPSGVGKTSICEALLKKPKYKRVITCTTRPPRGGEQEGVDYYFSARNDFEEGIRTGRVLEHAEVYGNLYGTPRSPVEEGIENGTDLLLNIDVQGARLVRDSEIPDLVTVFIDAPSEEELEKRLLSRAADSEEDIRQRLEIARNERKEKSAYQHIVVNDDFDRAVQELEALLEAPVESN